jgi:hypothetical protein
MRPVNNSGRAPIHRLDISSSDMSTYRAISLFRSFVLSGTKIPPRSNSIYFFVFMIPGFSVWFSLISKIFFLIIYKTFSVHTISIWNFKIFGSKIRSSIGLWKCYLPNRQIPLQIILMRLNQASMGSVRELRSYCSGMNFIRN